MDWGRYTRPALIGGVVTGVLSAVPFVNFGNCLCCMYVWVGSILAAYLLFKDYAGGTLGDGALVGLFSGICAAVVMMPISLVSSLLFDPMEFLTEFMLRILPPEVLESIPEDAFEQMTGASVQITVASIIIQFFFSLAIFALIGTLGGLIGAAIFRKKEQPVDTVM